MHRSPGNVTINTHEPAQSRELTEAIGGTWSVNSRHWRVRWCECTCLIHDVAPGHSPTLWEALAFIDPADRPALVERSLRCALKQEAFDISVTLTTAHGARKQARITGYPGRPGKEGELLRGTISAAPAPPASDAAVPQDELERSLAEWEFFGHALPHELRGPLIAIQGFATALADHEQALTEPGRAHLRRILGAGHHLENLLEGVLLLAPLGSRPVRRERVDLSALAENCIEALRLGGAGHQVEVHVQPGLAVAGDPELMRLVLRNLLANAWKFTQGISEPRITFAAQAQEGREAFVLRDNGAGFDMAESDRLFLPFQRLHSPARFGGTGLGLAIVRRAMERQGGSVWAEGAPGQGASFFFSL